MHRAAEPTPPPARTHPDPSFEPFADQAAEEARERRLLRRALGVAAALHLALLSVTVPSLYSAEVTAEPDEKPVFVVRTHRFEPPPPPQEPRIPEPRALRVPVPDPTPDEPEPLVAETPEVELDDLPPADDLIFGIPEAPPDPGPPEPIRAGGAVAKPVQLVHVQPRYPEVARRARVEGTVVVDTVIDVHGRVTDVNVLRELPLGLTEAAVTAVRQWTFEPSLLDGEPVPVRYVVSVHFELD